MNNIHFKDRATMNHRPLRFEHSVTTEAARSDIWWLWTDPATWARWDLGLRSASGPANGLGLGSVGEIISLGGQRSRFEVTEWRPKDGYVISVTLPLAELSITRFFAPGPRTTFVHAVRFDGPFAAIWAFILGRGFRRALPPTMLRLAELAEKGV